MYKSLSPSAFGVSGRQSELIELALTHGFRSIEVDIDDLLKKAEKHNIEHATRFITSGQLKLGSFEVPVQWRGEPGVYKSDLSKLDQVAEGLAKAGGQVCHATIIPASDALPYHENFELHRERLAEIGRVLAQHEVRMGVYLLAAPAHRDDRAFQFIHDADALVTLVKSIGEDNVGIYLDTWNWHFGGGTTEQLTAAANQVVAISFADAPAEVSVESITEEQRLIPSEDGVVDNFAYMNVLVEADCECPATVAPNVKAFSGMTREAIVQKCSSILDELIRKAGLGTTSDPEPALS
jgi:sugar phosphate isomerase/epimerase